MKKSNSWNETFLWSPLSSKSKLHDIIGVTYNDFHRFVPIFEDVFGPENGGTGTPAKLRKGKKILLWHQVRTTTWLLFIYAKSNFPGISDDLGTFSESL